MAQTVPVSLLVISLTVLLFDHAVARPIRMLDLDVSMRHAGKIVTLSSKRIPGGIYYTIWSKYKDHYTIGSVHDAGEMLVERDANATSRQVITELREDGTKYVVVSTTKNTQCAKGKTVKTKIIEEFIKRPTYFRYVKIFRVPLDVDLLTQESNHYINVELVVDWGKYKRGVANGTAPMDRPENLETLPMKFTVQEDMQDDAVIGRVTFGDYVIDDETEGLIERSVVWKKGIEDPRITVISKYAYGVEKIVNYKLGNEGFNVYTSEEKSIDLSRA
ncbi:signal peptide containing protein [Theileria equi strain WA]|uniref:Signal peptide containing protein n=1 Tax=Theileria equi strain WA TaxID=1537102 RepID=L1LF27_THEEQ|nr:signal peptide containing protein [Theileria equi strain WA]EKX73889.1 signal peptide containing protein [Theileria equi strain WA]|eukprot:XP_004833341.1 signal peptide containing protein [Theileria equi strain WA]